MPPMTIAIDELPYLPDETALFDAAIDPANMDMSIDPILIALITRP